MSVPEVHVTEQDAWRYRLAGKDLTAREKQVLEVMARGLSKAEACRELGLALSTLRTYLAHIAAKYGADRVTVHGLVAMGLRVGDITVEQPPGTTPLTSRQVDVLEGLALGYDRIQVGQRLYITHNSVKEHCKGAAARLGVTQRAPHLVAAAIARGDIP